MLFLRLMGEVAGAFDGAPVVGIEIGMDVRAYVVDHKTQVGDLVALGGEHLFVESLDLEQCVNGGFAGYRPQRAISKVLAAGSIKIIGASQDIHVILFGHRAGIFIKKAAVCFEVDYPALFQELAVALQK